MVTITYVTELLNEQTKNNERIITIPTTCTPLRMSDQLSHFNIKMDIEMPSDIVSITSDTHTLSNVTLKGKSAQIESDESVLGNRGLNDKDFILKVMILKDDKATAYIESDDEGNKTVCLALNPVQVEISKEEGPDVTFLIDVSGSMAGSKITAVINAMKIFIRLLPPNTSFNSKHLAVTQFCY